MSQIKVVPLGAGQDVGRSCILVTIGGKNIMFDCGMHMGYNDERRFPDFSYISRTGKFDEILDCVIISHFHLDHCGALPHFTEMCGYNGPIYMTYPTKAVCPILLEDFRKISVDRKGETNFFTQQMIKDCMKKVIGVNVHETVWVDDELEIKAYYAGHVLGAAMFYVRVKGQESVLYTGDYNMTPDRHLGSATVDEKVRPSLLITETTYATTIRDSKRMREGNFLKRIHKCVSEGGKVLIPVFALGRAQELCILIETYWERMGLKVPIYFSAGLTEKANLYYELFINWTNQKIKDTFVKRNMFDFKHIKPLSDRNVIDKPGPIVLFATPGMLHAGTSLEAFKKWCGSELNMCILPGYCVVGTVGNKVLTGKKSVEIDKIKFDIKCKIESLSFSAHADSKGIMQLIQQVEPENVMLVHGERGKMQILKQNIIKDFGIPVFDPPNGEMITIQLSPTIPADLSVKLLKNQFYNQSITNPDPDNEDETDQREPVFKRPRHFYESPIDGLLVLNHKKKEIQIFDPSEATTEIGLQEHQLSLNHTYEVPHFIDPYVMLQQLVSETEGYLQKSQIASLSTTGIFEVNGLSLKISVKKTPQDPHSHHHLDIDWDFEDDEFAVWVLQKLDTMVTSVLSSITASNIMSSSSAANKPKRIPVPILPPTAVPVLSAPIKTEEQNPTGTKTPKVIVKTEPPST